MFFSSQDQTIIQRLKERIAQLDVENAVLTKASSTSIERDDIDPINHDDDNRQDLETLMQRIAKLKVLIRVVNDRFGKSLTIKGKDSQVFFHMKFPCFSFNRYSQY